MTDYQFFCHSANVENLPLLLYGTNNHGNTQWKADREEFCPLVEINVLLSIRLDTVLHRLLTWSLCHGHFGPEELHNFMSSLGNFMSRLEIKCFSAAVIAVSIKNLAQ